jgi:sec-independent protein translocase protein TatA
MSFLGIGTPELILILLVLLLFFGKDKLPELARSIGKSFKELKSGFDHSGDAAKLKKEEAKEVDATKKI